MIRRRHVVLGMGALLAHVALPLRAATWDVRKFRNGAAQSWAAGLVRTTGRDYLADTFNAALTAPVVDMGQAFGVLAAAEVVATARGQQGEPLPKEVAAWLGEQRRSDIARLAPAASRAVNRILYGPQSVMLDQWKDDARSFAVWKADLQNLTERLRRPVS